MLNRASLSARLLCRSSTLRTGEQRSAAAATLTPSWRRSKSSATGFKARVTELQNEIRELQQEAKQDKHVFSQDPALEDQLLDEAAIDEFFSALSATTPVSLENEPGRLDRLLKDPNAKKAATQVPQLFSTRFLKLVDSQQPNATHARRLEQLWTRLEEAMNNYQPSLAKPESSDALLRSPADTSSDVSSPRLGSVNVTELLESYLPEGSLMSGKITMPELCSVTNTAAAQGDVDAIKLALTLAGELDQLVGGKKATEEILEQSMSVFAARGKAKELLSLLEESQSRQIPMSDTMRHSLVSVFLSQSDVPKALSTLRAFENEIAAPVKTYAKVIKSLFQSRQPKEVQEAWDLFRQMRLVAHPTPSVDLYAQMISACARGQIITHEKITRQRAAGETALDLFREMTLAYELRPSVDAFNQTILACAKTPGLYGEAVRIFRQMLALQDSPGNHYTPTEETFNALLAGCVRYGDLGRAKWILSEMLRIVRAFSEGTETTADADTRAMELFARLPTTHTVIQLLKVYAAYKVPSPSIPTAQSPKSLQETADSGSINPDQAGSVAIFEPEQSQDKGLPLTHQEVLTEVRTLFEAIASTFGATGDSANVWARVRPTSGLLRAYHRVLAAHLPRSQRLLTIFATSLSSTSENLFSRFGAECDLPTFELLLKLASLEPDRDLADRTAESIWSAMQAAHSKDPRSWAAVCHYIQSLAKSGHTDRAMTLFREMVAAFPPLKVQNKDGDGYRPSESQYPHPDFQHVQLLYQRLHARGDRENISFMTWALLSYQNQERIYRNRHDLVQ